MQFSVAIVSFIRASGEIPTERKSWNWKPGAATSGSTSTAYPGRTTNGRSYPTKRYANTAEPRLTGSEGNGTRDKLSSRTIAHGLKYNRKPRGNRQLAVDVGRREGRNQPEKAPRKFRDGVTGLWGPRITDGAGPIPSGTTLEDHRAGRGIRNHGRPRGPRVDRPSGKNNQRPQGNPCGTDAVSGRIWQS